MLDSPLEVDQQVESSGGQIQLILSARNSWALKRKTHTFGELSRRGQDPPVGETIFALTCKTRSIGRSFENTWERQGGNDFQWASRHIFSLGIPQAHKFPLPWARGHEKKKPEALVYRLVSQPSIFERRVQNTGDVSLCSWQNDILRRVYICFLKNLRI